MEPTEREAELETLRDRLDLGVRDFDLLDRALTHASIQSELNGPEYDYESLEFLGDAVLSLVVAHHLFVHTPDRTPGEYSRMRAKIVNQQGLSEVADRIQIGSAIRLGKGEVIKGLDEGVASMNIGSLRRLFIPYQLAYGEQGHPSGIPPMTNLVYEVELLGVK